MQQQFTNSPTNKLTLCHPPYWFHAVNRLENGLLGLIRTGLGLTNGVKKTENPKPVSVRFGKWITPLVTHTAFTAH